MSSVSPIAVMTYGGEYTRPCRCRVVPTQRTALVETTRWSISIIDSAPLAHSALTTAWTSCWCTTTSFGPKPSGIGRSDGASSRVTRTAGPAHRLQLGGAGELGGGGLQVAGGAVADLGRQLVDLGAQGGHVGVAGVEAVGLLAHQPGQVGVERAQVGAGGRPGAGGEQRTGSGEHQADGHGAGPRPRPPVLVLHVV